MPNDIGKSEFPAPASFDQRTEMFEQEPFDLRQIFELLLANRWPILAIASIFVTIGLVYSFMAAPLYRADGLVEVEGQSGTGGIGASLGDLGSLLSGGTSETETEIQILQSRMVLTQVVDKMNLLISAEPRRFPIIGAAFARWNKTLSQPASAPPGMGSFAWGGEQINVPTFEVPDASLEQIFTLVATSAGYELHGPEGKTILSGKVGEATEANVDGGKINIFVRTLVARPATEFQLVRHSLPNVIAALSKKVDVVEQGKQSGVIEISYTGGSADGVVSVINNIEEAYLRQNVERRSAEAQQSLEFLDKQLPDLKSKVETAQANLNSYQLRHGTVDVGEETQGVLQSSIDLGTRELELVQQRQQALQRFTAEHPVIKSIDEQLGVIHSAQDKLKKNIEKLPTTQQDVLGLMRDLSVATELYTAMLDTIQQLQVAKAGTVGTVRVVDHALKPFKPVSPRKALIVGISLVLGLFFGCGYVSIQRALLRGVDDPAELEKRFGLVSFAAIPFSTAQRRLSALMSRSSSAGENFIIANIKEDEQVGEALRSLRTSLHFALIEAANNVLMVTGPTEGIGKSFVSVNLAAILALTGKKVLVLDADLRRGHLNRYFGTEVSPGVTDFLAGDADVAAIIRASGVEGLNYISRGTSPPNPAELLLNERFAGMVKQLSEEYDHVILDSPPILPVTDASIIGRLAGSTLLVLKSAHHPMREIEESLKRLSNARVPVRGVIFNQVGAKVGSYGYGNYRYSYYTYKG